MHKWIQRVVMAIATIGVITWPNEAATMHIDPGQVVRPDQTNELWEIVRCNSDGTYDCKPGCTWEVCC